METQDVAPRVPNHPRPGAPFAGHMLGDLIGWGGFASVYRLRDTPPAADTMRCIKIGYRPDPTGRHADRNARVADAPTAAGGYAAGGLVWTIGLGKFGSVSPEAIGAILAAEYRVLRARPTELLPTVESTGTDHDPPYYVMEYLAGPTLRALLANSAAAGRLGMLVPFFDQLVALLWSAQGGETPFIHGDLKPENNIVTPERWRIIDPAPRDGAGAVARVATRAYNPTIDYSAQSDLRALAIILFEVIAGWQPFMDLSPRWIYPVQPGGDPFSEAWACLETERCASAAKDPALAQLLAWMREPPLYGALAAFVGELRRRPRERSPLREPPPGIPQRVDAHDEAERRAQPSAPPDTLGTLLLSGASG